MYQVLLHSTFSVGHSIFENGTKYQVLCTKYLQNGPTDLLDKIGIRIV